MKLKIPFIDRIWRTQSSFLLEEPLSADEAFARLDPLFQAQGTTYSANGDTLTYSKKNPAAQDKLATFTSGELIVEQEPEATRLSYDVGSTALFLCFIAPVFFIAFAQIASFINEAEKPALMAEKVEEEKKKAEEAKQVIELHWFDELLGAPEPKQPGEEDSEEDGKEEDDFEGNHSPVTAYVLAGVFFVIFLVGRVLEPYLLKRTFKAALRADDAAELSENNNEMEAGIKLAPPAGGTTKV